MKTSKVIFSDEMNHLSPKEILLEKETLKIVEKYVSQTDTFNGNKTRNFHAKSHGGICGKLEITQPEISTLFTEKIYEVFCRFSNAEGGIKPDIASLPAFGIGLKLSSQGNDLLIIPMVNFPIFPIQSVEDTLQIVTRYDYAFSRKNFLKKVSAVMSLAGKSMKALAKNDLTVFLQMGKNMLKIKTDFILNNSFYGIGCFRHGNYICKYRLRPEFQYLFKGNPLSHQDKIQYILKNEEISFLFEIQYCEDIKSQPIQNLAKEWPASQYQVLGKITFPIQQIIPSWDLSMEHMDFNPHHSIPELRPVGRIQEIRKKVYETSYAARVG